MHDVIIAGVGMTPVGEHWTHSVRSLAADAGHQALAQSGLDKVDALYVGNAYASILNNQHHLGALIADYMGLTGVEAYNCEAADASGGSAVRTAYLAIRSGAIKTALVIGVEKVSDTVGSARIRGGTISLDADYEAAQGATLAAMAAMLMRRYMHEYGVGLDAFAGFSVNAHTNGQRNPNAMFRNALRPAVFESAPMISDPVNLFDGAPDADGAAAVVLTSDENDPGYSQAVSILGGAVGTDHFMLQDRHDPLVLRSVERAVGQAYHQAGMSAGDMDLFELHDSFTIMTALSLEAAGFAERGEGHKLAEAAVQRNGQIPISTFGGHKSRGFPAGASGVYQIAEATLQLRGQAGDNQIHGATRALTLNLGGLASTAVANVLGIRS